MIFAAFCLLLPYAAFVLWCAAVLCLRLGKRGGKREAGEKARGGEIPASVVVALRDEEENVGALMASLLSQDYGNYEIILIDDHSEDGTWELISAYAADNDKVRAFRAGGEGKKRALKQAVSLSSCELIACTDGDCVLPKGWLRSLAGAYYDGFADLVIAPVKLGGRAGLQQLEFLSLQAVTAATALAGEPAMCNGASMAFAKSAYEECSSDLSYRLASGDDMFLLEAVKQRGGRIRYAADCEAAAITRPQESLGAFLSQRARWASKAGGYRDPFIISVGAWTLLTQLLLIASLGLAALDPRILWLWAVKAAADLALLLPASAFFGQKKLLALFPPGEILYPFYAVAACCLGLFGKNKWKNRNI